MTSTIAHAKQPARASRLRSSCNGCADAKIGCSKEKPTCARCARRDEVCIYATARRAGRSNHNKSTSSTQGPTRRRQHSTVIATPTVPPSPPVRPPCYGNFLPEPNFSDLFASIPPFTDSPLAMPSPSGHDLDDFLASICPPSATFDQPAGSCAPAPSPNRDSGVGMSDANRIIFGTRNNDMSGHNSSSTHSSQREASTTSPGDRNGMGLSSSRTAPSDNPSTSVSMTTSSANWFLSGFDASDLVNARL